MAAVNTTPKFLYVPSIQWASTDGNGLIKGPIKTANTAKDGTGTVTTIFTADATYGGFIQKIKYVAGSSGSSDETVARVFINNGSASGTISSNVFYDDITLSGSRVTNTSVNAEYEQVLNLTLPPGYKINVAIGTSQPGGRYVSGYGGQFGVDPNNDKPTWSASSSIQWGSTDGVFRAAGPIKTAATGVDGSDLMTTVFTADATNGGFAHKLKIKPVGTNAATTLRIFINNGSTSGSIQNNILFRESNILAYVISETLAARPHDIDLNLRLPLGYKINVCLGTTIAAGVFVTVPGSKY